MEGLPDMICPKCSNPSEGGRRPRLFRLKVTVPMEREGIFGGCQKWRCPVCRTLIYEELTDPVEAKNEFAGTLAM